jgi:hypothetical protein
MNNLNNIRNSALTLIFQGRLSETYQPNAKGIPFPASYLTIPGYLMFQE